MPGEVLWPTLSFSTFIVLVFAGVALLRLLPPKKSKGPDLPEDLRARLDELDQVKQRLGELEERVDFAERMLAKQREADRLGPGNAIKE